MAVYPTAELMPKAKRPRLKTSISVVGAGRLGQAFALALDASGYRVDALVARQARRAKKAAALFRRTNPRVLALGANQLARLPSSDLILIATPDDGIEETALKLAFNENGRVQGRTVLHTSGALSSAVLAPLAQAGFHTGSLHPLVSVSEPRSGAKALRGAFYCVEGDKTAVKLAKRIVSALGGKSFSIRSERKALYHAAAVMASPHVTALFDLATQLLAACGLSRKGARQVLMPLLESTVNNLRVSGPAKALTGTFARGDFATVKKHLAALSELAELAELSGEKQSEALEVYKLLGLQSMKLAEENGLDPQLLEQIRQLLLR
jgi:predicted short-subunit dehydrogenase-like oxidoreductase (DUF2520 family)